MPKKAKPTEQATAPAAAATTPTLVVGVRDIEPAPAPAPATATATPPPPAPAPAAAIETPPPSTAPAEKAGVLNIPITADGGPAWESMRESTKQRVLQMVQRAGISLDTHNSTEAFKNMAPMLWGMVSTLTTWAATRRLKHGEDDIIARRIAEVCQYSEQEIEVLAEPTAAMIAKYAPLQSKWNVEITFLTAVAGVHMQKAMAIQAMLSSYIEDKAKRAARSTTPNATRPAPPSFDAPPEE